MTYRHQPSRGRLSLYCWVCLCVVLCVFVWSCICLCVCCEEWSGRVTYHQELWLCVCVSVCVSVYVSVCCQEWSGRVTYHQELWLFPSLLMFHSDLSRHIITSRHRMMTAARKNAMALNRPGAVLPWHSGATGTPQHISTTDLARSCLGTAAPQVHHNTYQQTMPVHRTYQQTMSTTKHCRLALAG